MIKRLIAGAAVIALMLSSAGCVAVNISSGGGRNGSRGGVAGKGELVSESFSCGDFTRLSIEIPGELYYTVGEAGSVTIELYENLAEFLNVSNNNGTLVIDSTTAFNIPGGRDVPKIYVSSPSLEELDVGGLITVKEMSKITADSFALDIDGMFNGTLDLTVKNLKVNMAGVGNLILNGTADKAFIDSSGVGSIEAFGLQIKEAEVDTSGVGKVEISCSDKLIADISGVGGVTYKGNPAVEPNVSGIGGLRKAD